MTDDVEIHPACVTVPRILLARLIYSADEAALVLRAAYPGRAASLEAKAVELGDLIGLRRSAESA